MTPDTPESRPPHLRGLDPMRLVGVLDPLAEDPPEVRGWKILGIAGQGGFGMVWRAENEADGRLAAIKIAPSSDPETAERIEQEVEALGALKHPNIVALLDSGPMGADGNPEQEGGLFVAMEFVDGAPLSDVIPAGGLEPERAFALFRRICAAVAHAHSRGILHRDLKPSNILLGADDTPKVADFGLARPVHRRVQQLSLTRAGLIAGTAEYLPPEAYRSDHQPDVLGDVYALGVILYEMLTGTPPRGAWEPVSTRRRIDIRIDAILRRALDPEPSKRWPGVEEMSSQIEEVLAGPPRYRGTPLVTFPVRVADALWTVAGLFVFLASFDTLLHLRKSTLSVGLDLIGGHTNLTGGFQALTVILLASLPVSLWQLARLWRFRSIPLREALPGPFGLRLGQSRIAAGLVAAGQLVCVALPAFLTGVLHILTNQVWLEAGDLPWAHGLVVTPWESGDIVSPWHLARQGDNFWLKEMYGPPGHPLAQELDRIDFEPGSTPVLMVLAAVLFAVMLGVTLLRAVVSWSISGQRKRAISIMVPCGVAVAVMAAIHAEERGKTADTLRPDRHDVWMEGILTRPVVRHAQWLARVSERPDAGFSHESLGLYGDTVDYRSHGLIPREEIPARFAAERRGSGKVSYLPFRHYQRWIREERRFEVTLEIVELGDGDPPGRSTASIVAVRLDGILSPTDELAITRERFERTPIYDVENRTATLSDVERWAAAFFDVLHESPPRPGLSRLFLSQQLDFVTNDNPDPRGWSTNAAEKLMESLRHLPHPDPAGEPEIVAYLPGGRTRMVMPVRDPRSGGAIPWVADLVSVRGGWLCIRLRFGTPP